MDFEQLDNLKGFMPSHEGLALTKWAEKFSQYGPALEIGTFTGKIPNSINEYFSFNPRVCSDARFSLKLMPVEEIISIALIIL